MLEYVRFTNVYRQSVNSLWLIKSTLGTESLLQKLRGGRFAQKGLYVLSLQIAIADRQS
jgi:hypothetical protein